MVIYILVHEQNTERAILVDLADLAMVELAPLESRIDVGADHRHGTAAQQSPIDPPPLMPQLKVVQSR